MLKLKCYICKKELDEPGAVLYSPPEMIDPESDRVTYDNTIEKYDICVGCYWDIQNFILMK